MVCDDRCEHGYLPDSRGCPYCLHCNPDPYPGEASFIFYFENRRLINWTCVLLHHYITFSMYRYILSSILLFAILQPMSVQFHNAILPVRAAKPGLWMKMAVPHANVTNPLWSVHWWNAWYCKAYFRNWWLVRVAIFSGFDWVLGCQELCNVILHNRKGCQCPSVLSTLSALLPPMKSVALIHQMSNSSFLIFLSIAKNLSMKSGRLKPEQMIWSLVSLFVHF